MDDNRISSKVSIKHCSLCPGTTEYYCHDCEDDLCRPCKEMHVDILDIKYHKVTLYSGKFNNVPRHEHCIEHPGEVIEMYCEQCDIPVCSHCRKHQQHKLKNIRTAYQNKLLQFNNIYINIGCQSIYNSQVLLNKLKSDFTTFHKDIDQFKTATVSMSKRLKNSLNNLQGEISLKYKYFLVCRFLRKKKKWRETLPGFRSMNTDMKSLLTDRSSSWGLLKQFHLPQIQDTPHLSQHCLLSLTQKINTVDMIELLSEIKITGSGKQRQAGKELLPTLMSAPVLQKALSVTGVEFCYHISSVTSDRVWVSDWNNVSLIDTAAVSYTHLTLPTICSV